MVLFNQNNNLIYGCERVHDDAVDIRTRESLIEAKVLYLANRVKHNTRSSHEFGQLIDQIENLVAVLNEREVFNSSTMLKTPVFDLEQAKRNPKTLQQIDRMLSKAIRKCEIMDYDKKDPRMFDEVSAQKQMANAFSRDEPQSEVSLGEGFKLPSSNHSSRKIQTTYTIGLR